jgi:hypothetical protein
VFDGHAVEKKYGHIESVRHKSRLNRNKRIVNVLIPGMLHADVGQARR